MKPRRAPDGWTVVRVALFLQGAVVLGALLAVLFRDFLGNHPVLGVLVAVVYVALCVLGAYSKYAHHTAALALVGWALWIPSVGVTLPKDCPNCVIADVGASEGVTGFKTKAECETAGKKYLQDFYANATRNGQRVLSPPSTPVCAQEPSAEK
jgi:hypothetical protein